MSERYQHVQTEPSDRWTIQHNLFTRSPIIDTFVDFDGKLVKMLPQEINILSATECEVVWSVPRTGQAGVI